MLEAREDLDPAAYAGHAMGWVAAGAVIVGGCCEIGPGHIAALGQRLAAEGHELATALSSLSLTAAGLWPAPPRGRRISGGPQSRPVACPSKTDTL